ncbi:hypothetical protein EXIGLDRAFT_24124 [Exidia glandulosa HHB12029]|uniref:Uncharacterized protein n=1 Tax=Exidia glandulosa HHB12029 TaxID=1314781 RepID=A0A165R1T9_EXIGL|nr:hypothetical protein EXIGLDRAFT_24124 [Exidia glandulosa HHB12029]
MAPNYLSARSSEVILSDIRPTKIKPETLRAINNLLDELLLLVLSTARSTTTGKLKSGLLKVLPTTLGKDAILEAEIELRAYHERTAPADPATPAEPASPKDFPLQPVFELLRMKCEAYSTLSDFDGDAELEAHLQARIASASGPAAPRPQAIAPAALYLTAILEHVCEHVLSNVARVVARDSSRTTAHVQDLHVALCEDETIYGLFKNMKVQQEIVAQLEEQPPRARRSRSFSHDAGSPATMSPLHGGSSSFSVDRSATAVEPSEESFSPSHAHRPSMDRVKSLNKMFKGANGSSGERSQSPSVPNNHKRSESAMSERFRRSGDVHSPTPDSAEDQEFDDLMRSGTTLKLSLTPDRLQTELKGQRKGSTRSTSSSAAPPPGVPPKSNGKRAVTSPSGLREVDSIDEGREDDMPTNGVSRSLSKSVRLPADVPPIPRNNPQLHSPPRSRAVSSADPPSAKIVNHPSILRKPSLSAGIVAPSAFKEPSSAPPRGMPKGMDMGESGFPKRNRHVKRDSLDLDELSDEGPPIRRKASQLAPKGNGGSSAATRELIDFLSEGPPEIVSPTDSIKPKSGSRLRTMVSRLARGSTERLKDAPASKPLPAPVRPSASASLNAVKSRSTYTPPAAPYYPRPSSPHSNSSSSNNDLDNPEAVSTHRKTGQTVQWEPARAPPTSTPTTPSSPAPVRASSHREATIIKGLPSPTPEVDKPESNGHARSPPKPSPSHPTPPKVVTSNMSVPKLQASDLRDSVLKATSPQECRLLVDMFLARCGYELPGGILEAVTAAPMTEEAAEEHENSMVDILLGEGPAFGFAAFEPQPQDAQPAVVEAAA